MRFNKMHSVFISALYGMPSKIEMLIEIHGQDMNAQSLTYAEIIARFNIITEKFPANSINYHDSDFQKSFINIPYSIIESTLVELVNDGIRGIWRQHQVDKQYLPVAMHIIKLFPEIIERESIGSEAAKQQLKVKFKWFAESSINRTIKKQEHKDTIAKIDKSANRVVNHYDGRYDHLPKEFAAAFLQKHAHIKAIAFAKRHAVRINKKTSD